MVALLLQSIRVESGGMKPMPESSVCSQIASLLHLNVAVYSASQEEEATVFCSLVVHEMIPEPRVNEYPPTLLLVSRQLAQSKYAHMNMSPGIDRVVVQHR